MCGRYVLTAPGEALAELFGLDAAPALAPRYNIAPTQDVLVVRRAADGGRELAAVRWGLIPHWARDARTGARPLINARSETAHQKPAFRDAFRRRRCLVPASGFYEWQRRGAGRGGQPYYFHAADDGLLAIAGLWARWPDPLGEPRESCTLLTTTPNEVVRPVHERMPVLLPRSAHGRWLDPATVPAQLTPLLAPCPAGVLAVHPVSPRVNNPREDVPDCIAPLGAW